MGWLCYQLLRSHSEPSTELGIPIKTWPSSSRRLFQAHFSSDSSSSSNSKNGHETIPTFFEQIFFFLFLNEFIKRKKKIFGRVLTLARKTNEFLEPKICSKFKFVLKEKKGFWNHFSKIINSDNTQFLGAGLTMKNGEPSPQGLEACPILKVRLLWLIWIYFGANKTV